jgi:hypothetical protein
MTGPFLQEAFSISGVKFLSRQGMHLGRVYELLMSPNRALSIPVSMKLENIVSSGQLAVSCNYNSASGSRANDCLTDWPKDPRLKEIGMYNRLQWEEGIEGWCVFLLTNHLHWMKEEVDVYLAHMRKALGDRSVHAYHEMSVVYGRKPLRETE